MVSMTTRRAEELFGDTLTEIYPTRVVAAVEKELAALRKRDKDLADSATAAGALAMAFELDNPHNSATSKSMCRKQLAEALEELRDRAPAEKKGDSVDDLADRRKERRATARLAAAAHPQDP